MVKFWAWRILLPVRAERQFLGLKTGLSMKRDDKNKSAPMRKNAGAKTKAKTSKPAENSVLLYISAPDGEEDYADIQVCLLWYYAALHHLQIIGIHSDQGENSKEQPVLKKLLADIHGGKAHFAQLLLMNPRKWGGSSASGDYDYCESVCKKAGIEVRYAFSSSKSEAGPCSALFKSMRRMAEAQEHRWGLHG
jgi:hypothetical protein